MPPTPIIPPPPQEIKWDRETRDWWMYFDGLYVGSRKRREDALKELQAIAYRRAWHDGVIAAMQGKALDY